MALQIGGVRAPSPVGELGNVEMTQAITLVDSSWQVVGPDALLTGADPGRLRRYESGSVLNCETLSWNPSGRYSNRSCVSGRYIAVSFRFRSALLLNIGAWALHDELLILLFPRLRAAVAWCLLTPWLAAGYLPSSGGLLALQERLAAGAARQDTLESSHASSSHAAAAAAAAPAPAQNGAAPQGPHAHGTAPARRWWRHCDSNVSLTPSNHAQRLPNLTQNLPFKHVCIKTTDVLNFKRSQEFRHLHGVLWGAMSIIG